MALFLIVLGLSFGINSSHIDIFFQVPLTLWISLFALHSMFFFIASCPWHVVIKGLNVEQSFYETLSIYFSAQFINLFIPGRGGDLLQGLYFKKVHGLKLRTYWSLILFLGLCGMISICIVGALSIPSINFTTSGLRGVLGVGCILFGLVAFIILRGSHFFSEAFGKLKNYIDENIRWKEINQKYNIVFSILGYTLNLFLYAYRMFLLMSFMYVEISFWNCVGLSSIMLILNLFPILPGNIGIRELSFAYLLTLIGQPYEVGMFIAIIDRMVQVIFLSMVGIPLAYKYKIMDFDRRVSPR